MKQLSAAVFLIILVLFSGCAVRRELVRESAASVILIPAEPTEVELFAASELQKYLKKISGAEIKVTGDYRRLPRSKNIISIGNTPLLKKTVLPEISGDGLVLKTVGDKLFILGGRNGPGTLYGVYAFLELLGCRWYAPGKTGEYLPRTNRVAISRIDIQENPANQMRGIYFTPETFAQIKLTPAILDWMGKNRLNTLLFIDGKSTTIQPDKVLADLLPELRKRGIRHRFGKRKDFKFAPATTIYRKNYPLLAAMGLTAMEKDRAQDEIYLDAAYVTAINTWETPLLWLAVMGFWTPNGNEIFLIEDYCRKNFGPAAKELINFYQLLNRQAGKAGVPAALATIPAWKYLFPKEVMNKSAAQLDRALPLAGASISPEPARRIKRLQIQLKTIAIMNSIFWNSRDFPSKSQLQAKLDKIAELKRLPDGSVAETVASLGEFYRKVIKFINSTPMITLEKNKYRLTFSPEANGRILEFGGNGRKENLLAAYLLPGQADNGETAGGLVSKISLNRAPGHTPLPFKICPRKMDRDTGVLKAESGSLNYTRTIELEKDSLMVMDLVKNLSGDPLVYNLDLEMRFPFGSKPELPGIPGHYRLKLVPAVGKIPVNLEIADNKTVNFPACREFHLYRADKKPVISGNILSGKFNEVEISIFSDTITIRLKGATSVLAAGKTGKTSYRIIAGK